MNPAKQARSRPEARGRRPNESATVFGTLSREIRLALGVTQHQVAARAGLGLGTISRTETGRFLPGAETLRRHAEALGINWTGLPWSLLGPAALRGFDGILRHNEVSRQRVRALFPDAWAVANEARARGLWPARSKSHGRKKVPAPPSRRFLGLVAAPTEAGKTAEGPPRPAARRGRAA